MGTKEFRPDVISEYASMASNERPSSLVSDVKNQLLQLGWKAERSMVGVHFRSSYKSPDGTKTYYSLKKLCQDLSAEQSPIPKSHSPLLLGNSKHNGNSSVEKNPCADQCPVQDSVVSKSGPEDDVVYVEPEYCPRSIIDYITFTGEEEYNRTGKRNCNVRLSALTLKAKKHLSFMGWVFWLADKKGRRELRYKSPNGKNYYSLRMACKGFIKDGGCVSESVASSERKPEALAAINMSSSEVVVCASNAPICSSVAEIDAKQASFVQPKRGRKRKTEALLSGECSMGQSKANSGALSSVGGGKRGRFLRSSKRKRQVDVAVTSDSLTHNPRTVISWLIDNKVVLPRTNIYYIGGISKTLKLKHGRLLPRGIKCDCCSQIFSLSSFESHAGSTEHRPAANIFLEDGRSLLDCQKEALQKIELKREKDLKKGSNMHLVVNDSICTVCHYGGELMLCDQCPSSFHHTCLGLKEVPPGDWFCPSCCCKICSQTRYKEDSSDSYVDNRNLLVCDQCEFKYHIGCIKSRGFSKLKDHPNENWFCSGDCKKIFQSLQKILGKRIAIGKDNLTWTLLKNVKTENSEADRDALIQIESKLNVALEVIHECFEPIVMPHSGRDIVEDVIFSRGSILNRSNFRGFYTVILEKNEEVISVATIRIYGKKVVEVPLVATRFQFRRLGMCRILMNELEKKLIELDVERMILPAVHSVLNTWINSFGFERMTCSERARLLDYTFWVFTDTIMCQKLLKKPWLESSPKFLSETCY